MEDKEKGSLGVISGSYLPEDFDIKQEIASYRFWLMCKLRYTHLELFQKKHELYLENLKKVFMDAYPDKRIMDRMILKITMQAYYTIPEEFWSAIKMPSEKNKMPVRVGKKMIPKESYMVDENYVSYKRDKKNKKKK